MPAGEGFMSLPLTLFSAMSLHKELEVVAAFCPGGFSFSFICLSLFSNLIKHGNPPGLREQLICVFTPKSTKSNERTP